MSSLLVNAAAETIVDYAIDKYMPELADSGGAVGSLTNLAQTTALKVVSRIIKDPSMVKRAFAQSRKAIKKYRRMFGNKRSNFLSAIDLKLITPTITHAVKLCRTVGQHVNVPRAVRTFGDVETFMADADRALGQALSAAGGATRMAADFMKIKRNPKTTAVEREALVDNLVLHESADTIDAESVNANPYAYEGADPEMDHAITARSTILAGQALDMVDRLLSPPKLAGGIHLVGLSSQSTFSWDANANAATSTSGTTIYSMGLNRVDDTRMAFKAHLAGLLPEERTFTNVAGAYGATFPALNGATGFTSYDITVPFYGKLSPTDLAVTGLPQAGYTNATPSPERIAIPHGIVIEPTESFVSGTTDKLYSRRAVSRAVTSLNATLVLEQRAGFMLAMGAVRSSDGTYTIVTPPKDISRTYTNTVNEPTDDDTFAVSMSVAHTPYQIPCILVIYYPIVQIFAACRVPDFNSSLITKMILSDAPEGYPSYYSRQAQAFVETTRTTKLVNVLEDVEHNGESYDYGTVGRYYQKVFLNTSDAVPLIVRWLNDNHETELSETIGISTVVNYIASLPRAEQASLKAAFSTAKGSLTTLAHTLSMIDVQI